MDHFKSIILRWGLWEVGGLALLLTLYFLLGFTQNSCEHEMCAGEILCVCVCVRVCVCLQLV